jgi:hypothetical protein
MNFHFHLPLYSALLNPSLSLTHSLPSAPSAPRVGKGEGRLCGYNTGFSRVTAPALRDFTYSCQIADP